MATVTLRKHFEYPVCFEVFRNPHILKCLHTYCLECLKRLKKDRGQIECPECRQITRFKDLKKDFRVDGMVESFQQLEKGMSKNSKKISLDETSPSVKCVCNNMNKPVVGHCEDCEEYLCSDCKVAHKKLKLTRTHKVKSMADIITTLRQDLHKASDDIHKEIKAIDKIATKAGNALQNIRLDKKHKLAEVDQVLDSLIEAIENHRKTLGHSITEADSCLVMNLSTKQKRLNNNKQTLQSWLKYVNNVMECNNMATLSDVISLHRNTMAEQSLEIADFKSEIEKMNITPKSVITMVKGEDVIDLKSIINIKANEVSDAGPLKAIEPTTSGFQAFLTCKYEKMLSGYNLNDYKLKQYPEAISMLNGQFWCAFMNHIRIIDKRCRIVKKIPLWRMDFIQGMCLTHTGDIIISCDCVSGLHQFDSAGNYLKILKEGSYGRSFTVGEKVYVVETVPSNFKVIILQNVDDQWVNTSDVSLTCENIEFQDQIIIHESGIYIASNKNQCIYHHNLISDLLQCVDVPKSEGRLICLIGVDERGDLLMLDKLLDEVWLYTKEKQWLNVPFLSAIKSAQLWCEGDDVWVVNRCEELMKFTKYVHSGDWKRQEIVYIDIGILLLIYIFLFFVL